MLRDPVASPRRRVLGALGGALGAAFVLVASPLPVAARSASAKPLVEVWKSPTCGCCNQWIKHLQANGFDVCAYDTGNGPARARLGMPIGSPGMEQGNQRDPYDVLLVRHNGSASVWKSYD
jgi:hypothetical protein